MKGHEPLIAMRLRGRLPASVHLRADGGPCWEWTVPAHAGAPIHADIVVDPEESIGRLDLRCFVGLTIHLNGQDPERVKALSIACMEAGAARVIACCPQWTNDSEGLLSWPM
jgi:hypothetical protein